MTIPTFVNLGTVNDASSTTTTAPALPASRVNGNVLIAAIEINGSKVISLSAGSISNGWTLYATQIDNNSTLAMAWRIVDGNESACSFTWTGAHIAMSRCIQFTGNDTTNPIGATDWATGTGSATTGGGISSTRAGSAVLAIIGLQTGQTPTTPAGWTARASDTFTAGSLAWRTFNTGLVNQGDSVNGSFGNAGGVQFALAQIEIMSPGAAAITTTIDQTLLGITQAAAASPNAVTATVAQTLAGFTQALTDTESMPDTISTVLFAPTQALAAAESIPLTIDQTLRGFTQEIDVSDIAVTIAQTLPGFTQEIDTTEQPKANIATVLAALSQEMDTAIVLPTTIAQTLPGFSQEMDDVSALDTRINMILGQPRPPPDITVSVVSQQGSVQGTGFVRPHAIVGASDAGKLIVIQVSTTASTTASNVVSSLTNIPGQPPWQLRAAMHGNQLGSGVCLETWYLVSNSSFGPANVSIACVGNQITWESLVFEYGNIDTDQPWDDDSSVPATAQNNSLSSATIPSLTTQSAHDFTMQVGYYGSNTPTALTATADFTLDAIGQQVTIAHNSATAIEISRLVPTAVGGLIDTFATGSSSWCFIADTIRGIATARTAMTQEIDVMSNPAASIDMALRSLTQEIDVMSNPAASIDMTLPSLVQTATVRVDPFGHIDQTLFSILQKVSPTVVFPPGSIVGTTIQTLPGLVQEMDVTVSAVSNIAQTLPGLVQEADIVVTTPNVDTAIDMTLAGFVQEIDIDQTPAAHIAQILNSILQQEVVTVSDPAGAVLSDIDQTLPGFTQEIDATLEIPVGVDTVLSFAIFGLQQEIDIVEEIPTTIDTTLFNIVPSTFGEIIGDIDQTLTGFSQEIDDDVELIFRTDIDQTLAGLAQEADVTVEMVAAIDQVLAGFQQEADVTVEMEAVIDQTLTGLMQELDATTQDENTITTVLPGFGQNIIVEVDNPTVNPTADIAAELMGFSQRCHIVVKNPKVRHPRGNSGMIMPSKDMPIHPGELELFRRKVYARNVDGLVPISPVAQTNLTTTRYPRSRPAVNRTPLGKPKS